MSQLPSLEFDIMHKDEKTGYVRYNKATGEFVAESYTDIIAKCLWISSVKVSKYDLMQFISNRCWSEYRGELPQKLGAIGLSRYNEIEIIKKTKGKMYGDFIWFRFKEDMDNGITYEDIKPKHWR